MAEKTARKQRGSGRPFQRGWSGNPAGRPLGSRNRVTLAVEGLMQGRAEAITQRVVNAALEGDMAAVKLVIDRIAPARKSRPIQIDLPEVNDAAGIAQAQATVVAAVAGGEITPEEATGLSGLLEGLRRALETGELEARIRRLEGRE
ncbi:DUF5681 domain-containing protein [Aestuariivirga sp.]|uniref:DUF5681 domain-containing protein n=1 Tax=Aestuariivirga sp. TaxID=2650926 RepID=UPI0037843600